MSNTEEFIKNFKQDELSWIWAEKLPSASSRKKQKGVIEQDDGDPGEDYNTRLSRWLREGLEHIRDVSFWRSVCVSFISRGPLFHAQRWLESVGEFHKDFRHDYKMAELVAYRCESFATEFEDLVQPSNLHAWQPLLDFLEPAEAENSESIWLGHAAFHVLALAANWHRRVTRVVERYPCRLMWLVCEDAQTPFEQRETICAEILNSQEGVAKKLAVLFQDDLHEGAQTGCLRAGAGSLYNLVMDISVMWKLDVQEIEGTNNIVQHIGKISPNLSWPLMSARIVAKKKISLHTDRERRARFLDGFPSRPAN